MKRRCETPTQGAILKFRNHIWGRETGEPTTTNPLQRQYDDLQAHNALLQDRMTKLDPPQRSWLSLKTATPHKIDRRGIFEFVTDWNVLRIDEVTVETSRLVNAVKEMDARPYADLDSSAANALKTHLWALPGCEDYSPLLTLDLEGNELSHSRGLFAYMRGFVWGCRIPLSKQNWKETTSKELGIEYTEQEDVCLNRHIPVDVRREVWRRDQGQCVTCGSREQLEYDHMIPVALGGSNMSRNIQLLCEPCNRRKGATLG